MSPLAKSQLLRLYSTFKKIDVSHKLSNDVRRSWYERLFTHPWRPWQVKKINTTVYLAKDGTILMSADMKKILENVLLSDDYPSYSV